MPEIRQAHMKWLSRKSGVSEMDARDGKLDGPAPTKIVRSDSAMKAVGSARKENRERLMQCLFETFAAPAAYTLRIHNCHAALVLL